MISRKVSKGISEEEKKRIILEREREFLRNSAKHWNYITPEDFYKKIFLGKSNLQGKKWIVIDLRRSDEFRKGHIKGAKNIFWRDILRDESLRKIPKDKQVFLICYVGHTSSQVLTLLRLLGYKNICSIKFGYGMSPTKGVPVGGWLDYGYPVVKS